MTTWWIASAVALTPEAVLEARPAAEATIERCATAGCSRADAAEAVFLVAVSTYLETGVADGDLAATLTVLDPDLRRLLPSAYTEAIGTPATWTQPLLETGVTEDVRMERMPRPEPTHPGLRALVPQHAIAIGAPGHLEVELRALARLEQDGRLRTAIAGYRHLYETADSQAAAEVALVRLARLYLQLGRDEIATTYYGLLTRPMTQAATESEQAVLAWLRGQTRRAERTLRRRDDALARAALDWLQADRNRPAR